MWSKIKKTVKSWYVKLFVPEEFTDMHHNNAYNQFTGERLPDGRHRFYKVGKAWYDRLA